MGTQVIHELMINVLLSTSHCVLLPQEGNRASPSWGGCRRRTMRRTQRSCRNVLVFKTRGVKKRVSVVLRYTTNYNKCSQGMLSFASKRTTENLKSLPGTGRCLNRPPFPRRRPKKTCYGNTWSSSSLSVNEMIEQASYIHDLIVHARIMNLKIF